MSIIYFSSISLFGFLFVSHSHVVCISFFQVPLCVSGSNKYCLDKNYGGVFIFWDHLFGTFEAPDKEQKIVYGILIQPEFFNPISHQVSE
ncbi:Alkylglycerol monooxygenase [Portunus trituberculatus]|uniref:Alkylglycerol monooxygenase n=1 Tax=Portunus trituberculatus TaxID=210409 RepID=A0A5B7I607_PORTR|nr:Alkylglycerol monooxygenase [Portunus trituberculatus]